MTIRPICIKGNPVLHRRAAEVTEFNQELRELVSDMFETMDKAPGVGLAATQVGVGLRVFTYTWTEDDGTLVRGVVINPSLQLGPISEDEPDEETESEGCLSFPTYRFPIKRADQVVLTGTDLDQNPVQIEATGWLARIFQHEYDHLDGYLYIDKLRDEFKNEVAEITAEEGWGVDGLSWLPGKDKIDA
ncbi:MAG: peptide deformylase [Micrococcales bacterium]